MPSEGWTFRSRPPILHGKEWLFSTRSLSIYDGFKIIPLIAFGMAFSIAWDRKEGEGGFDSQQLI